MQRETLPWVLEEEILSLVPAKSIARFRSVCKRWNAVSNDKKFVKKHLAHARPQFILLGESKVCSVEVDVDSVSIELHRLPSDIPGYNESLPMTIEYCDGLLVYATCSGFGVCNPWLRQIRWMNSKIGYDAYNGMGYDNSRPDSHYKIIGCHQCENIIVNATITEFGSGGCKFYEFASNDWDFRWSYYSVSLNGYSYWVGFNHESRYPFIQSFDFSMESFKPFCILPSKDNHPYHSRSLAVFKGDRFSLLEQDCDTGDMEVWVTKKKIENWDGEAVEWIKFMNVTVPEWSSLDARYYPPSYFIDDKSLSLVVCCFDKNGQACIYIAKEDRFHEIEIKDLVDYHPRHRTYFPFLVPVPTGGANDGVTFTALSDLRLWQEKNGSLQGKVVLHEKCNKVIWTEFEQKLLIRFAVSTEEGNRLNLNNCPLKLLI